MTLPVKDPSALWMDCGYKPGAGEAAFDTAHAKFVAAWTGALKNAKLLHDGFHFSDTGNAKRMVDMCGANFRWLTDADTFRVWTGTVWEGDTRGNNLLPRTNDVIGEIPNPKWRLVSESAAKRRAMIEMTKGEIPVLTKRGIFDRHPMLLNVENGTIDLETQTLREFNREDYLTQRAPVVYDILADCPKFDALLDLVFAGDVDLIHYFVKLMGYTLTGDISEQIVPFLWGYGKNGKTTLAELMRLILGPDYAKSTAFSTFVQNKYGGENKYDMANFVSKRMVTAAEPGKGKILDEGVLKYLSGGDVVNARQIYGVPFDFEPECKIWLLGNAKPRIIGTDEGIWRRLKFVEFNVEIPAHLRVKDYHDVLFAEEGPGILNRLLEGVRDWLAEGLKDPATVLAATAEFRESQDTLKGYFVECTLTGNMNQFAKAGDLYDRYVRWAEEKNEFVIRQSEFFDELKRRGFMRRRTANEGVRWYGITLKDSPLEREFGLKFDEENEPV